MRHEIRLMHGSVLFVIKRRHPALTRAEELNKKKNRLTKRNKLMMHSYELLKRVAPICGEFSFGVDVLPLYYRILWGLDLL